jgi:epoxyqueuosine reductase
MDALEDRIKRRAHELGFDLVGITTATEAESFPRFREWLDAGFAGDMDYLHCHADARRHPESILAEVRCVIMVAMNYQASGGREPPVGASGRRELASGRRELASGGREPPVRRSATGG